VTDLPCDASLQLLAHLQPPVLRDASVCLLLLLLLLDEATPVRLRVAAGELLLLNVLPPLDVADRDAEREAAKLRAVLAKAVDDAELFARLLPPDCLPADTRGDAARLDVDQGPRGGAAPPAPAAAEAEGPSSADVHRHVVGLVAWWDDAAEEPSHAARRDGACARLARQLQASGSAVRRNADRAAAKRAKRAKQRAERLHKASAALSKGVADAVERQRQRLVRGGPAAARRVAAVSEGRGLRLAQGEQLWRKCSRRQVEQLMQVDMQLGPQQGDEARLEEEVGEEEEAELVRRDSNESQASAADKDSAEEEDVTAEEAAAEAGLPDEASAARKRRTAFGRRTFSVRRLPKPRTPKGGAAAAAAVAAAGGAAEGGGGELGELVRRDSDDGAAAAAAAGGAAEGCGGELVRRDSGDGTAVDEAEEEAAGAEADAEEETAPEGAASRAGGPRGRSSGARLLDKARSASWRRTTRKKAQPAGELARRDADGGAAEGAAAEWAPHVLEQAEAVLRVTEGAIASHDAERTDVFKLLGVHRRSIADEEDTASVEDVDWSVPPSEGVSEHSVLQGDAAT
jgi:hypothetical protein